MEHLIRNLNWKTVFSFFIPLFISASGLGQEGKQLFEHVQLQPGISHNMTCAIIQDSQDFIWFGTIFGLIRYDGYGFIHYQNSISDSSSLSNNHITCLYEDRCGTIWIGTRGGGLNRYNRLTDRFTRYIHNFNEPESISSNFITAITEDADGNIWVGTMSGLNKIEKEYCDSNIHFHKYFLDVKNVNSLSSSTILSLYADTTDKLWIGTNNGLTVLAQKTKSFERFFHFDFAFTYCYNQKLIEYVNSLLEKQNTISSILNITDLQNRADTFYVKTTGSYLILAETEGYYEYGGEIVNRFSDLGWLESADQHKTIWKPSYKVSLYAGGGQKNRIKMDILTLLPGHYRLRYISDDSHSTAHWNNHPPYKPEWYGIQLVPINNRQKTILRKLLLLRELKHPNSLSNSIITSIVPGFNPNHLWIGTAGGGLDCLDLTTRTFSHITSKTGNENTLAGNYVTSILKDSSQVLWIGTSSGLSRFNIRTKRITNFYHYQNSSNSLTSNYILSMMKDRSGILWFGTNLGSVEKINNYKQNFDHYRINNKSDSLISTNDILAVYSSDSSYIWLGTNGSGLFHYNLHTKKAYQYRVSNQYYARSGANIINAVVPAGKGHLWIGTSGGGLINLDIHMGSSKQYVYNSHNPASISTNNIYTLYLDSKKRLWIGSKGYGLNLKQKDKKGFKRFAHNPKDAGSIASSTIYSIQEDNVGNIWFGTCKGLSIFNESLGRFTHYSLKSDVGSICVYHINMVEGDKNIFWLGTSNGLIKFNFKTKHFIHLKESLALTGESIFGIEYGKNGNLWLNTYKGLIKLNPQTGTKNRYDADDGLQSNIFNMNAHTRLPDGKLLFGGINGFNIFDPSKIGINTFKPKVHFTKFKVFNENRVIEYDDSGNAQIELDYTDNFFSIEFAALDYSKPYKNHFLYRLKDVDKNWVHLKNRHSVSYTNIKPGVYIFELMGSNSSRVWNKKKTILKITIIPPFWRTSWFRFLLILLFFAVIGGLIFAIRQKEKNRTAMHKKIAELKLQALRARMNPHFIFNTINSIQYFISENAHDEAYFYLSKFSKLLRATLNSSELAIVPLVKELEILELYLTLQQLRFEEKLKYAVTVDPDIECTKIGIPTMLIQPYVENAIEHGISFSKQSGIIKIDIKKNGNALHCSISDNGIGINKALQKKKKNNTEYASKGMQLTRERLRIINESNPMHIDVKITDLHDIDSSQTGTRVFINIPFQKL